MRGRALVRAAVLSEPLLRPCGEAAVYSDLGFLLMGLLLEELAGASLSELAREQVFGPLGLTSTDYLDRILGNPSSIEGRTFVPTGYSAARRSVVQGEVNDDNAWALGGAAPHAGVFSTALDVAALGEAWLETLSGDGRFIPSDVARSFATRDRTKGSARALGWDTPSGESSLGQKLGRGKQGAIGHLGFTGTSLWVDLDARIVVALLTNHVHPSGRPNRAVMNAFRRGFHDAVAEALGLG